MLFKAPDHPEIENIRFGFSFLIGNPPIFHGGEFFIITIY
ncbi:hypothetical protein PALI_a2684 [Pseudoalteromonas aliena SW19]|uniref:Uncharacterized protein n=1 Tax=Pseudoalteromonas aliena SW19 TaxID=1314866 RepID=A0ABR9E229_9GAMM|nr:hypothetical protein [Pseudoalteromonas aliena SW19]